jgi:hypothetical protein
MLSGVSIGINVERTTTLTTSDAPNTTSAASDNTIELDTAKIMVEIPKEITAINIIYPSFFLKGFRAKKIDIINAPMAGAERNNPKPRGPIFKILLA